MPSLEQPLNNSPSERFTRSPEWNCLHDCASLLFCRPILAPLTMTERHKSLRPSCSKKWIVQPASYHLVTSSESTKLARGGGHSRCRPGGLGRYGYTHATVLLGGGDVLATPYTPGPRLYVILLGSTLTYVSAVHAREPRPRQLLKSGEAHPLTDGKSVNLPF